MKYVEARDVARAPKTLLRIALARFLSLDAGVALYYLAFVVWMSISILYSSSYAGLIGETVYKAVRYITYLLLLGSEMLCGRYDRLTAAYLLGAWVVVIGIVNAWQPVWIDYVLFVFCSRSIQFKDLARISLIVITVVVGFVVISSLVGITPNYTSADENNRIRCFLGFRFALYLPQYLFTITGLTIYLDDKQIHPAHIVVLFCANIAVYLLTDSRLSFWLAMALISAYIMTCLIIRKYTILRSLAHMLARLLPYSICIFAGIGILVTLVYNPSTPWMETINSILGNRLSLGQAAFELYPPTLFGQKIAFVGNSLDLSGVQSQTTNTFYVDCLYLKLLLQLGMIPSAVLLGVTTCFMRQLVRERQWILLLVVFFIAAHCLIDDLSLNLNFNVFLLALASLALARSSALRNASTQR